MKGPSKQPMCDMVRRAAWIRVNIRESECCMNASGTGVTPPPTGERESDNEAERAGPTWALDAPPSVVTTKQPAEVLEGLSTLSRRGRLPGFRRLQEVRPDGSGAGRFAADVFGLHYDRELTGVVQREGDRTRIVFTSRLRKKMPVVIAVVFILATWPGAWLTHSMLETYFGWYPSASWVTYAWYIPLMLLSIPVLLRQYRVSMSTAHSEMAEVIEKVRAAVDGTLEQA